MPVTYEEDAECCVAELTIRGILSKDDYAPVMPRLEALIERCGAVGVVEVIQTFAGFEGGDAIVLEVEQAALESLVRVAIVSDIGWFCPILSSAPAPAVSDIRSFRLSELEEAREWVREGIALRRG